MKKNLLPVLLWCFFGLFFGNGYTQNIFSGEPIQVVGSFRINAVKKLQLNIYPNPVTENLTVSLDAFEKGQIQWVIFNKDGKQMNTAYYNYDGFVNRINIPIPENFQKGVYTLMIQSSKQKLTGEFIVQKLK